jgi:PAS domain S-box-containing protein
VPQSTASLQDLQSRLAAIEATLARSRRQFTETQQLARVGSWEWDIPAGTVWWSDELFRIYGLEPGAVTPTYEGFLERVHPDDRESVDERNRSAFADHQPFDDVKRVVRADGVEILMRTQGEMVVDDDGSPLRMIGVCEDVSAERRAAERADARDLAGRLLEVREQLDRALGQLNDGEADLAAATIAETRRTVTSIADGVLGAPGASARTGRRFRRDAPPAGARLDRP